MASWTSYEAKYSILDRALETELLPLCREHGIVVRDLCHWSGVVNRHRTRDYVPGGARADKLWFQREEYVAGY